MRVENVFRNMLMVVSIAAFLVAIPGRAEEDSPEAAPSSQEEVESSEGGGVFFAILMYLPNRVLDVFDVARARVRVGPGVAVSVRATQVADVFLGSYASVYAGLPGPRGRKMPCLPIGLESYNGAELSVAKVATGGGIDPSYGIDEIGVGVHALLVGADVGFCPLELLDFFTGLLFIDLMDDDF